MAETTLVQVLRDSIIADTYRARGEILLVTSALAASLVRRGVAALVTDVGEEVVTTSS